MIKALRKTYPLYIFIDLFFMASIFYLSYLFRYNPISGLFREINLPNLREYTFVFILWFIFIVLYFKRRNLYSTDRSLSIPKEIYRVVISILYTSIVIASIIFFAQYKFFSRQIFIQSLIFFIFFLSAWRTIKRIILRRMILKGFHNINVLVAGAGKVGKAILEEIKMNPYWGFRIIGFLDDKIEGMLANIEILGKLKDFPVIAKKYFAEELIITIPSQKQVVSELIKEAKDLRLGVRVVPENLDDSLPVLDMTYLGVIPLLTYKERKRHPTDLAVKRFFDFFVSLIALIILLPVFIIIAIFIKIDSKGTVFYMQKRLGLKGKLFNFYKFRSMVKNADELKNDLLAKNEVKDGIIFKIRDDPRITGVGKFLRTYSLDEFPQLFNVLKGDMSLVGPRPPTPDEVEKYSHLQMQRLSIRPGITGLSQVKGRSELTFKKWVRWDLWYLAHWSFGLDLQILWWTILAVLKKKGAY
jgi:exopolysaccharide biosynthesis polyprenyl glycosylphosphotransferase